MGGVLFWVPQNKTMLAIMNSVLQRGQLPRNYLIFFCCLLPPHIDMLSLLFFKFPRIKTILLVQFSRSNSESHTKKIVHIRPQNKFLSFQKEQEIMNVLHWSIFYNCFAASAHTDHEFFIRFFVVRFYHGEGAAAIIKELFQKTKAKL